MPIINRLQSEAPPAERDDYSGLRFYEGLFLGLLISALFWSIGLWLAFT